LTSDWVDFLRRSFDTFVAVLQAEQRMGRAAGRRHELEAHAEKDGERLRELEAAVSRAVAAVVTQASPHAPVTRCSDQVLHGASAAVAAATSQVKSDLAAEVARIEEGAAKERRRCKEAFERLLLVHDLPGSESELRLALANGAYTARLHGTTPYGMASEVELEIAPGTLFAAPLRVGSVSETLEIQVSKTGGWVRKESKLQPERLARFVVTACALAPRAERISLRGEGLAEGYDFVRGGARQRPTLARVMAGVPPAELELVDADVGSVEVFLDKIAAAMRELGGKRKALASLTLGGDAIEDQRLPSLLVQRVIEAMAPTVREIAARSGTEQELVIRRLLGDGRREERFIRRAELLEKLAPLGAFQRALFTTLALGPIPGAATEEISEVQEISGSAIIHEGSGSGPSGAAAPQT
jgi:hypothetical protein